MTTAYDIAISFCGEDQLFASDLHQKLREKYEVFFYPRNSEVTAGTSGNASMYEVFKTGKLNVVVYRPRWGTGGFTVPERDALIDRRLVEPENYPFFIMGQPDYPAPPGFPSHMVRCNRWEFTLDDIVRQIEARFAELGETPAPKSTAELARRRAERREFEDQRSGLLQTSNGVDAIKAYMQRLIEELARIAEEYKAHDPKQIIRMGGPASAYSITDGRIGIGFKWLRDRTSSIRNDRLEVTEYLNALSLPGEGLMIYFGNPTNEPKRGKITTYTPEIGPSLHFGWVLNGSFWTADLLADALLRQFLALSEKHSHTV